MNTSNNALFLSIFTPTRFILVCIFMFFCSRGYTSDAVYTSDQTFSNPVEECLTCLKVPKEFSFPSCQKFNNLKRESMHIPVAERQKIMTDFKKYVLSMTDFARKSNQSMGNCLSKDFNTSKHKEKSKALEAITRSSILKTNLEVKSLEPKECFFARENVARSLFRYHNQADTAEALKKFKASQTKSGKIVYKAPLDDMNNESINILSSIVDSSTKEFAVNFQKKIDKIPVYTGCMKKDSSGIINLKEVSSSIYDIDFNVNQVSAKKSATCKKLQSGWRRHRNRKFSNFLNQEGDILSNSIKYEDPFLFGLHQRVSPKVTRKSILDDVKKTLTCDSSSCVPKSCNQISWCLQSAMTYKKLASAGSRLHDKIKNWKTFEEMSSILAFDQTINEKLNLISNSEERLRACVVAQSKKNGMDNVKVLTEMTVGIGLFAITGGTVGLATLVGGLLLKNQYIDKPKNNNLFLTGNRSGAAAFQRNQEINTEMVVTAVAVPAFQVAGKVISATGRSLTPKKIKFESRLNKRSSLHKYMEKKVQARGGRVIMNSSLPSGGALRSGNDIYLSPNFTFDNYIKAYRQSLK